MPLAHRVDLAALPARQRQPRARLPSAAASRAPAPRDAAPLLGCLGHRATWRPCVRSASSSRSCPPTPLRGNRLTARGLLSPVPRDSVQTESARMKTLVAAHIPPARRGDCVPGGRGVLPVGMARRAPHLRGGRGGASIGMPPSPPRRLCAGRASAWRGGRTGVSCAAWSTALVGGPAVSGIERDHLVAIGCDSGRIEVVPNGTTAGEIDALPVRRAGRLIYPGPVTYSANLDAVRYFVHEILPLVRRVRPDVTFVVTGSTDGVDVGDLEAEDGVSFTGRLADINAILAESAACVVPLRIGGGTRLKVLQAMALVYASRRDGKGDSRGWRSYLIDRCPVCKREPDVRGATPAVAERAGPWRQVVQERSCACA